MRINLLAVVLCLTEPACLDTLVPAPLSPSAPSVIHAPLIPTDVFVTLNDSAAAHSELCSGDLRHPHFPDDADLITKAFCQDLVPGGAVPTPHGLDDLLALLGLDFKDRGGENGAGGNPGFAVLGHSSALTARKVSSITPTAFVFTPPPADGSAPSHYAFLAFDPGETFVEVAVDDATVGSLNFYLVLFDKACGSACGTADLLTPALTSGWSNVRVYEDETALGNTIADCRVCHDPDHSGNKLLRMQEIAPPFTHWLSQDTEGGHALLDDFHRAHGSDEDYGPIPAALIDKSSPALMAKMVTQAGFGNQPNPFDSAAIESESKSSAPLQPIMNLPPGHSATWLATYGAATAGQFIAAPYHDVKVTDPGKLAKMSDAYQAWLGGAADTLPDLREVFLDEGLRDMGFAPTEKATGRVLLTQMCQECHNANLDPAVTRDRFLVDQLDQMGRDEKDLAVQRLQLPVDTRLFMPPPLFRTVTDAERDLMVTELQK